MNAPIRNIGVLLAERLGLPLSKHDGHDLAGPCVGCQSSDAFRLHAESGVAQCYSCHCKWSPLQLAEAVLKNRGQAKAVMVELGLLNPKAIGQGPGATTDPIEVIARQKGVPADALKVFGAKAAGKNRASFPCYGPDGAACTSFSISMRPGTKAYKGVFAKGKPAGVFLPHMNGQVRLPKAGETWYLVEGVKDAAALQALGFLVCGLNTCRLAAKFARLFAGVDIVIVPDRDQAGENGAHHSARALFGVVQSIRIATLPVEIKRSNGADIRDVLKQKDGRELVLQAIADAQLWDPAKAAFPVEDDRPEIEVTPDEHTVNDQAIAAISRDKSIFQRGSSLVQIMRDHGPSTLKGVSRPASAPRIIPIKDATLRESLSRVARFVKRNAGDDGDEMIQVHPPTFCVGAVAARGHWPGVRHLEGVISSPILRANGTILQTAGYDPATGLFYEPDGSPIEMPAEPTHEDAMAARDLLLEVVADFPFASDAHRAAWLAFVLTPLARHAFAGPSPLFLIDANVRGSGKSLLADTASIIVTGRDMPRTSWPSEDDEMRKRILAIALGGDQMVLIDNIAGELGCSSLDAALTGTVWKDRILGRSESVEVPLLPTWSATGNNVVLRADTSRRVCHIRLDSMLENPEEREGFKHPNLLKWVRADRAKLLGAALTILAAYCRAGWPDQGLKPWGSFEGWSSLVRQAVVWVGLPDPGETRQELARSSDREATTLRALIYGWPDDGPEALRFTAAELIKLLSEAPEKYEALRNAVLELCPAAGGNLPSPRSLGTKLRHLKGRVVGGKSIDDVDRHGIKVWFVREIGQSASDLGAVTARSGCFGGSGCSEASPMPSPSGQVKAGVGVNAAAVERADIKPPIQPNQPAMSQAASNGISEGHRCTRKDWAHEPQEDGRTRTTCGVCGRFVGYRNTKA